MRAGAGDEAVLFTNLGKLRRARQIKLAGFFYLLKQGTGFARIASHQIENEALEIRCFGNIHRRAAGVVRVFRTAHAVHAGFEKLIQNIVFVGRKHQFFNR